MKWGLVGDSGCDLKPGAMAGDDIGFDMVPLTITVEGKDFVDAPGVDLDQMIAASKAAKKGSSSSCPSPEMFAEQFRKYQYTIAFTITGSLSGSYNSAVMGAKIVMDEDPEKKIHVVDTRGTSGSLVMGLRRAKSLIEAGCDFDTVVAETENYMDGTFLLFSLVDFDNLIKNGRMSKISGIMAGAFGIRAVAANTQQGTIDVVAKPRGELNALKTMVKLASERKKLEGRPIVISHCKNKKGADLLAAMFKDTLKVGDITVLETGGLCTYYCMPGGLIVTF